MEWTHLPNAGGLYDQDPILLDRFMYIFAAVDAHEKAESDKQRVEAEKARAGKGKTGSTRSRLRGGRR